MTLLTVAGVDASYGKSRVLHGIDLQVDEGEVAVVLGANGAGKTTLMNAIAGTITRSGAITLSDSDITRMRPDAIANLGLRLVPQGRGTFGSLSVRDNLMVGAATRHDSAQIAEDLDRWLSTFPVLGDRVSQPAGTLSGGEQQMLAIARALMGRPRILLCDEPSLGLAPVIVKQIFGFLREINQSSHTAMIVVEQNAQLALELAHRVYLLEVGHVVASGSPKDFRDNDAIRRAYLGV